MNGLYPPLDLTESLARAAAVLDQRPVEHAVAPSPVYYQPVVVERVALANGPVVQCVIPGAEASAHQAAAARAGALKPRVPQKPPGDLFGAPEPAQPSLFGD